MNNTNPTGKPAAVASTRTWGQANEKAAAKAPANVDSVQKLSESILTSPSTSSGASKPAGKWGATNAQLVPSRSGKKETHESDLQPAIRGAADLATHTLQPSTFGDQIDIRQVSHLSNRVLVNAMEKDGTLSQQTHEKQMQGVDVNLNKWIENTEQNSEAISKAVAEFFAQVSKANQQIAAINNEVSTRFIAKDPRLDPEEVQKAINIQNFITSGVILMQSTIDAAMNLAAKGGGAVSNQVLSSCKGIIEVRTLQVQLFVAKIEVFRAQEKHALDLILKVQEAKLKEQQQLFTQLESVARFWTEEKDADAKRQLEKEKADLEKQITLRQQLVIEEEANNRLELERLSFTEGVRLKEKEIDNKQEIEKYSTANEKLKITFHSQNEAQANQLNAQTVQQKQQLEAQVASHQINKKAETERLDIAAKTATTIVKPSCIVM